MKGRLSKSSLFYLVMLILFLFGFIGMVIIQTVFCITMHWRNLGIAFVPILVFLTFFILSIKGKVKKAGVVVLMILISIVLAGVSLGNIGSLVLKECTKEIDDVKYYNKVLDLYGYPKADHVEFFPEKIPEDVVQVKFYQIPQFLQGGSEIYLFMELPKENIEGYVKKYATEALTFIRGSELNEANASEIGEYYFPQDFMNQFELQSSSEDWNYYVFVNEKDSTDSWNHGSIAGVAINQSENQVVYYAEQW